MLNRNAEALFWVGRYIERAENHARLINVHYHIQHEGDFDSEEHKWARLIDALGLRKGYMEQFTSFTERDVLSFITLDRGNSNSLFSCVSQARNNLRTLREKLPSELWDMMNSFYLWLGEKQVNDIFRESPDPFYTQIKERAAMFYGAEQSVMPRENEWHFMESGRFLERAENTVRIVHSVAGAIKEDQAPPYPYLLAILKSVSGYQAFRKYYADAVSIEPILEFLLVNTKFPRSVHYAFAMMEQHLEGIELESPETLVPRQRAIRQAGKIKADLAYLEREDLRLPYVLPILDHMAQACQKLGGSMASAFFQMEGASA
ncbi:hypothetical protein SY83_12370 [Paenibacillus swuensis]|uniref:DUF403 domain-containing protein n=1 Tax=Paenibacillus swuensis TaxID=1178515 RepID=A0A172TIP3_9BACL|nr:alpha-E domain-containing protein [Paenibacillus swuensis]ANE46939.1 hypothetical protein SY83_12370 [Paenibacillus swuensis]